MVIAGLVGFEKYEGYGNLKIVVFFINLSIALICIKRFSF